MRERELPGKGSWRSHRRGGLLLLIFLSGCWAFWQLELGVEKLLPTPGGLALAGKFLSSAWQPALSYESAVPEGTPPLLSKALRAAATTLVFASAAMSLALLLAVPLGFFASSSWWMGDPAGGESPLWALLRRSLGPVLYGGARFLIAGMRSVHELIWAVFFLAAVGLTQLSAVVALAIPYAGTLAKIFSEMIDETPREVALAYRGAGAGPLQVFVFGLLPRALPDMTAYAFYRFECCLRSSAILGFFGYPTLGFFLAASFENLHYREVWTYLYTLFALVVLFDWWSGALRRRFVA